MEASSPSDETIYLDTELRPNASLSPLAFTIVMSLIGIFSFAAGILYLTIGAWPVFGFFGLDALAIWYAFRVSRRSQAQVTYLRVDNTHVRLWHMQKGKPDKRADLPTAFVRIGLDQPGSYNSFLTLQYGDKAWIIGRFLPPKARADLAEKLRSAVYAARNQHRPAI